MVAILSSPNWVNKNDYLNVSTYEDISGFELVSITETYEDINNGKEVYFLDYRNKSVKVLSITKEPYKGKIYDVDVGNDVVLVRRKNSSAIWSGNSNNGSFYGDATINKTNYKYGEGAAQFDGDGDYVDVPYSSSLALNNYTLSTWVKINVEPGTFGVLGTRFGGDTTFDFKVQTSYIYGDIGNGTAWLDTSADCNLDMPLNTWWNIVYVVYVNGYQIYVNGTYCNGESFTGTPLLMKSGQTMRIGNSYSSEYMNGTIDDVMIFNRSLSAAEIQQLYFTNLYKYNQTQWYLYVNQSKNSTTGLDDGVYTYSASARDTIGNENTTETRTVTIDTIAPTWRNNQSNLTGDDKINNHRWFYVNWSDDNGLNSYIFSWNGTNGSWTNDTAVAMTGLINQSNVTKIINLSQGNTIGWRFYANDTANNFNYTDIWTFLVNNTAPSSVNLSYPLNNSAITNTTPRFNWTNASDADNDTIYYDIFIRCLGGCSVDNREEYNLTDANYTPSPPLKYYQDDGYSYEWWVRAFDNISYSENSSKFNFTISSSVTISLPTANVSFGAMNPNDQNDTTDNNPTPIVVQNDGNCYINVNITVDSYIWESNQSPSEYFQFKIDNVTSESGAFNSTASATVWTYFNSSTNITSIYQFNYSDDRDSAEIDINLTVPQFEAPGGKESTIIFTGYYVKVT